MSNQGTHRTTIGKALQINLDATRYGTFAEIGAGQEVARYFFLAGKASQTIAKTMSAYDMTFSDAIYGKERSGRYVCESRLDKMLTKEYDLLLERLSSTKGQDHCFFSFANTCTTGDIQRSHGWMGLRFQEKFNGPSNEIILHVRMLENSRLGQQDALGILGVNLLHAAFFRTKNRGDFLSSLVDNLRPGQVIIDYLRFSGPDLKDYDNQWMNTELVRRDLAEAIIFSPEMEVLNVADVVYNKAILLQPVALAPSSQLQSNLLDQGLRTFKHDIRRSRHDNDKIPDVLPLLEMTFNKPAADGQKLESTELIKKIKSFTSLGQNILVTNHYLFYEIKRTIRLYSKEPFWILLGATKLPKVFDPVYYTNLEGGLPEGLALLLEDNVRLLVYNQKVNTEQVTAGSFVPDNKWKLLYQHYLFNGKVLDLLADPN